MFDNIDYLTQARGRYTDQFKNSVNFDILMIIWMMGYQEIQEELISILDIKDVDKASGVQLDIIGDIVGQPRSLQGLDETGFFGFQSDAGAQPFGSLGNSTGGVYASLYRSTSSQTVELSDSAYRVYLKAKILSNNASGTPEEVIAATRMIFSTDVVELYEDESTSGSFSLYIGRPWNDGTETAFPGVDETALAQRLLPRPAGVRIDFVDESLADIFAQVDNWVNASDALYVLTNYTLHDNIGEDKF